MSEETGRIYPETEVSKWAPYVKPMTDVKTAEWFRTPIRFSTEHKWPPILTAIQLEEFKGCLHDDIVIPPCERGAVEGEEG